MSVFIAMDGNEPVAGAICSALGRRGVFLFGATGDRGTRNKASYLVQWRVINWLKERGCEEYDLHGSNAVANPGVFQFKMGLCGRNGREIERRYFDAVGGRRCRTLLTAADAVDYHYKRLAATYRNYRAFPQ
jgi:hypothetical protein